MPRNGLMTMKVHSYQKNYTPKGVRGIRQAIYSCDRNWVFSDARTIGKNFRFSSSFVVIYISVPISVRSERILRPLFAYS